MILEGSRTLGLGRAQILPREDGMTRPEWSLLEVFAAWSAAGVAGQEAEHEDPDEEEDNRVNRDLEGEHGRACGVDLVRENPALRPEVTAPSGPHLPSGSTILWGPTRQPPAEPVPGGSGIQD